MLRVWLDFPEDSLIPSGIQLGAHPINLKRLKLLLIIIINNKNKKSETGKMEGQIPQNVRISAQELGAKYQGKREIYRLLVTDAGIYLCNFE